MKSGIYRIQSKSRPKRFYIGSAVNIKQRWRSHKSLLFRNKHHSIKLQNHVNKYGFKDLVFTVVEVSEKEDLIPAEQKYLDHDLPYFNTTPTAGSSLGRKHTEEARRKIGEGQKGKKISKEHKRQITEALTGRKRGKCSEEARRKISEAKKGRKLSEEHKQNIGEAQKRRWRKKKLKVSE